MFMRPEKAKAGGERREFVYPAIVERHFGKHTGLPPSAKACPGDLPSWKPAAKRVQAEARRNNSATAPARQPASIREKSPWECRSRRPQEPSSRRKSSRI